MNKRGQGQPPADENFRDVERRRKNRRKKTSEEQQAGAAPRVQNLTIQRAPQAPTPRGASGPQSHQTPTQRGASGPRAQQAVSASGASGPQYHQDLAARGASGPQSYQAASSSGASCPQFQQAFPASGASCPQFYYAASSSGASCPQFQQPATSSTGAYYVPQFYQAATASGAYGPQYHNVQMDDASSWVASSSQVNPIALQDQQQQMQQNQFAAYPAPFFPQMNNDPSYQYQQYWDPSQATNEGYYQSYQLPPPPPPPPAVEDLKCTPGSIYESKRVLAVVACSPLACTNFVPLVTIGARPDGAPTSFMLTAGSLIDWPEGNFDSIKSNLRAGDLIQIMDAQPAYPLDAIEEWVPTDAVEVWKATFNRQEPTQTRKTMFISENTYINPWTKKESRLSKKHFRQLGMKACEGLIMDVQFVKFGDGTRVINNNQVFIPGQVTTPINMEHKTLHRYTMAVTVSVSKSEDQFKELRLRKDVPQQYVRCGEIILTALLVNAGVNNKLRKQARIENAIVEWEVAEKVSKLVAEVPKSETQFAAIGQAYSRGGLLTVRNKDKHALPNKPCNLLIDEVEFDEKQRFCKITAYGPTPEVMRTLKANDQEGLISNLEITPSRDIIIGRDMALQLKQGNLKILGKSESPIPKELFKAVLGLRIKSTRKKTTIELELDDWLTPDQKQILIELFTGIARILAIEAVAGSGKTTVLCAGIKLCLIHEPESIPVISSMGNATILHICQVFQDEPLNPPVALTSLMAAKKLDNENREIVRACSIASHAKEVMELFEITASERKDLEALLKIEQMVEADLLDEDDDELRDAPDAEGYFVDELVPKAREDEEEEQDEDEAEVEQQADGEKKERKKPLSRGEAIRRALRIFIKYRKPSCIAGTTVMVMRVGKALKGVAKTLFVDEAGTVPQIHLLNTLAEIGSVEKLVLVGDTRQLTVYDQGIHQAVKKMGFESALELLQKNECPLVKKLALTTCFRSHPEILAFNQKLCYGDYVLSTPLTEEDRPGMKQIFKIPKPYFFLNVEGDDEPHYPVSRKNVHQHKAMIEVLEHLRGKGTVAVLALYAGQKHCAFSYVQGIPDMVATTVDAYQGNEADYVVILTTKVSNAADNDFVNSEQRKTVALTRAKRGFVIIGNEEALIDSPTWGPVLSEMRTDKVVFSTCPPLPSPVPEALQTDEPSTTQPLVNRPEFQPQQLPLLINAQLNLSSPPPPPASLRDVVPQRPLPLIIDEAEQPAEPAEPAAPATNAPPQDEPMDCE